MTDHGNSKQGYEVRYEVEPANLNEIKNSNFTDN